jgi:pimeloyl-ACP methyl ester carboxylesterase
MGDLRGVYRDLEAPLVEAGYRVAVMDVRGHGDSDADVRDVGDRATAGDIAALVDELGAPALVLGSSFGGSAAVLAAADRPDAVAGLVLLSPFLREQGSAGGPLARLLYRVLFARPWGTAAWVAYYRRMLNRGRQAAWLPEHLAAIRTSFTRRGRLAAFRRLAVNLDHSVVEPAVDAVRAPALVLVGALDPDYKDPAAELAWMAQRLGGQAVLVEDAAHYAHAQRPDVVVPAVLAFAAGLREGGSWRADA